MSHRIWQGWLMIALGLAAWVILIFNYENYKYAKNHPNEPVTLLGNLWCAGLIIAAYWLLVFGAYQLVCRPPIPKTKEPRL